MALTSLRGKLSGVVDKVLNKNASDKALIREVKIEIFDALVEADVDYDLATIVVDNIEKRSLKEKIPPGLGRRKTIIAALNDELVRLMGEGGNLTYRGDRATLLMMVGIQGSGKTTHVGKLSDYLRKRGMRIGVICADTWRPGAFDQLKQLCEPINIEVYGEPDNKNPIKIAKNGIAHFQKKKADYIILDTSGRHRAEQDLLKEMQDLEKKLKPDESILVIDGTLGQQAFSQAQAFGSVTELGSIIISKLDGGAKGGGAISAAAATGVPIKFIGEGETIKDMSAFNPVRFVSQLLGMGDLEGLLEEVKNAQLTMNVQAEDLLHGKFTLRDMMEVLEQTNKNSIGKLLGMLPGSFNSQIPKGALEASTGNIDKFKAIMGSMTEEEVDGKISLSRSRIDRISRGSGTSVSDVKTMMTQYKQSKKMMKVMRKGKRANVQIPGLQNLQGFR